MNPLQQTRPSSSSSNPGSWSRCASLRWLPSALFAFFSVLLVSQSLTAATKPEIDEVIVVLKTHFDIGYTDMASNVVQKYRTTMIDNALAVVDASRAQTASPAFAWTIPGWPLHKIMEDWPGQTPVRRDRLEQAFREGRFVVHALPFTTHTELLEPEDLVRGLGYASQLSRAAGLPLPRDAKMTDVPCHSWFLPTLLHHAGVEFLHLGCNPASRSPQVPLLFWWEGPDQSRLLTMYSAGSYGSDLRPPEGWPYRTWLALIHTGDNHGPPAPDEVKKLFEGAARDLPGVKVRIGRLSDFSDALRNEKARIPVIRGDMPDTWIHGPMCDPQGASLARRTRPAIQAAESLHTHLEAWGAAEGSVSEAIRASREQSLLYGEHTWGGALAWVYEYSQQTKYAYGDDWKKLRAQGRFDRIESSWEEHSSYIRNAAQLIRPVLQNDLAALAAAVATQGPRVVVFNPLPWKRSGLVEVSAPTFQATKLKPLDGGPSIPTIRGDDRLQFFARDLPPSGYRTYVPADGFSDTMNAQSAQPTTTIENEFLELTVDAARGGITRLLDKKTGRALLDETAPYRLGQFLYERFDADQVAAYVKAYVKIGADWAVTELGKPNLPPAGEVPYRAASPRYDSAQTEVTAIGAAVTLRANAGGDLPFAVTTRVILPANAPWFDLEVTIHDKPADPWPEAGWICLPVAAERPAFRLGRQAGVTDPARDLVPGSNRDLFAVHTGLTLRDRKGHGLGFCPLDHAVVSLGRPGCWRYELEDFPRPPVAFVNVFNNQWTTNFRLWNSGSVTSRVRVWAIRPGMDTEAALVTPAAEARTPLLAALHDGPAGALPTSREGLQLSRPGTVITAFGPNPDGAGTLLRLWEGAGAKGRCEVRLPAGFPARTAQPVDLRGTPKGAPISIRSGRFNADLSPSAPASFVLLP